MLKKRGVIVDLVRKWQARNLMINHKFSMELPKAMEQALAIDAKNGNTL